MVGARPSRELPVRIGVLTGGGDCPGLNAVIRSVVRTAANHYGSEVLGFRDGWRGLLEDRTTPLDIAAVDGLLTRGGTTLGSARVAPGRLNAGLPPMKDGLATHGIDVLIPIGGEGTLTAAHLLSEAGVPVVGIPKTIDNDIDETDLTFGFDTAVSIATEMIDRLHTTAESHQRVLLVEVMGRHAGWIALHAGLAAGAHLTLVPEEPFDGEELEARTGKEVRTTVLGHVQRGGTPTSFDRVLATRFGLHATVAAHDGRVGRMVALRGTEIELVPLADAVARLKTVTPHRLAETLAFTG